MNDRYDTVSPTRYVKDGEVWSVWKGKGRFYVSAKNFTRTRKGDIQGHPQDIFSWEPWMLQFKTTPVTAYNPVLGLRYRLWLQNEERYVFALTAKAETQSPHDSLVYTDKDLENWLLLNGMHVGDLATSTKGFIANFIHVLATIIVLFWLMLTAVLTAIVWLLTGTWGIQKILAITTARASKREYKTWGGEL